MAQYPPHSDSVNLYSTTTLSIFVVLGFSSAVSSAATLTVPGSAVSPNSGVNTVLRTLPRVYQSYIDESQLASITQPIQITGMRFRLAAGENWRPAGYVGTSWPNADLTFADWTIQMGQASSTIIADEEIIATTTTFNQNMEAAPIITRTGGLTLSANSFQADGGSAVGAVHSFGPLITFTTPYVLNPGETLVYAVAHSGYGATGTPLNAFFETADFANGIADAVSSTVAGATFNSTPNGFSSPYIVQFEYVVIPEPGSASVLLLTGLAALRRRSRSRS